MQEDLGPSWSLLMCFTVTEDVRRRYNRNRFSDLCFCADEDQSTLLGRFLIAARLDDL